MLHDDQSILSEDVCRVPHAKNDDKSFIPAPFRASFSVSIYTMINPLFPLHSGHLSQSVYIRAGTFSHEGASTSLAPERFTMLGVMAEAHKISGGYHTK